MTRALEQRESTGVVDPRSGELVDLTNAPHAKLIDVFLELQKREKAFKEWRTAVEDELVRRHGDRRAAEVVGDHEVDVDVAATRAWDIDDLEGVITDLTDRGVIDPRDTEGLIREKREVNGIAMKKLIDHADGDLLMELSRCFTWKKGRARVKVTPVAQLER